MSTVFLLYWVSRVYNGFSSVFFPIFFAEGPVLKHMGIKFFGPRAGPAPGDKVSLIDYVMGPYLRVYGQQQ